MSKLKEKVNPALEFKSDPMRREIHENMLKSYEATKNMSAEERINLIKEKATKFRNQQKKSI